MQSLYITFDETWHDVTASFGICHARFALALRVRRAHAHVVGTHLPGMHCVRMPVNRLCAGLAHPERGPFFCPCWRKRVIAPLDKLGDACQRDFATGLDFCTGNCCRCDFTMLRHVWVSRFAALIDISAGGFRISRFYRSALLSLLLFFILSLGSKRWKVKSHSGSVTLWLADTRWWNMRIS